MANNTQINATTYYRLPCGKFLEDFIYHRGLNFNMGSALKYVWRAGYKDGESEDKDLKKANHYIEFEAKCRSESNDFNLEKMIEAVRGQIYCLREEAYNWNLHDEEDE